MINLDAYIERTVEFKLNGEVVKVKEPSNRLFQKINEFEMSSIEGPEIFEKQKLFALEILNRNTTGHQFKEADIAELPQSAIHAIMSGACALARKGIEDPN